MKLQLNSKQTKHHKECRVVWELLLMIDELVVICTYVLIVLIIKALMAEKGDAEESEPLAEDAFADFDQEEMDVYHDLEVRQRIYQWETCRRRLEKMAEKVWLWTCWVR